MERINGKLLNRLQEKLGIGRSRVYQLIDDKVNRTHLPRNLAAIALASELGFNISRFATVQDLAAIRHVAISAVPPSVVVPEDTHPVSRQKTKQKSLKTRKLVPPRRGTKVFVIHGRDDKARKSLFELLRALALKPLEWNQIIKRTGQGSPYVGDILEMAFREAAAVVVLFTPDDLAKLKKKYWKSNDFSYEKRLTGQARPNVLFEAGMAFGKNPNSTILVQLGEIRPFSDVLGRHVVHLGNDPTSRQEFATKLANGGCNVDTTGTDWLTVGDFHY
jgi:predicted nucleotide-binding protein